MDEDRVRGASDVDPEIPKSFKDQPTLATAAVASLATCIDSTLSICSRSTTDTGSSHVESDSKSDQSTVVSPVQRLHLPTPPELARKRSDNQSTNRSKTRQGRSC